MFPILAILFWAQALRPPQESAKPLPDLGQFLKEVRAHLHSDRILFSQYTFTQKQTNIELDKDGKVKKTVVRVFEVYPSLEDNLTYMRLISKDGKPVSQAELDKADRAYDKKVRDRRNKLAREGTDERTRRLAKEAEQKRKEDQSIDELFHMYRISMDGRERIEGLSTIKLSFQPRAEYKPKSEDAQIMKKFSGRAWFGEEDPELVRLEVELIDSISFGFGILARVNKGATGTFQRRRVNNEIWLPAQARFAGSARLFLLKGLRLESISEFSDYRKFTVSSTVSFPASRKQ